MKPIRRTILGMGAGLAIMILYCGCVAVVVGAGAGAGVYSYLSGELRRVYPATFKSTSQATKESLEALKIEINDQQGSDDQLVIKAKHSDGTPVTVKVTKIDATHSEVSVRSGVVGVWDKKASELIHVTIEKKL